MPLTIVSASLALCGGAGAPSEIQLLRLIGGYSELIDKHSMEVCLN
jgi:hypothetical protein